MTTLWSENVPRHCKQFYEHVETARVVVPACRDFISGEERDPVEIRDTHEIWVDGWASTGGVGNTRPGIGPSEPQPAPSRLNAPRGLGRRRGGVGRGERTRQQKMGAQRLCERRARRRERAERGEEREVHVMPADGNGETAGGRVVAAVWDGFVSGRGPRAWRGWWNLFCYDEGRRPDCDELGWAAASTATAVYVYAYERLLRRCLQVTERRSDDQTGN